MAFTERLAVIVEANASKAIAEFRKVGAAAGTVGEGAENAGAKLGLMGKLGATGANLAKAGIVAGVAAAGAAITKFAVSGVKDFTALASEIRQFQRATGATAEDASHMVAAFKMVGIETTTASTALFRLGRSIETSGDKLAAVGVTAARTSDGNVDMVQTLLRVGDAYRATNDPAERANLLMTAFGRGGLALAPILGKTRGELEELFDAADRHHAVFTQSELDSAKEFGLATKELGEAFTGLEREAGKALVPFLTDLAKASTQVIELVEKGGGLIHNITHLGGLTDKIGESLGGGAKALGSDFDDLFGVITHGTDYTADAVESADQTAEKFAETQRGVAEFADDTSASIDEEAKAFADLEGALFKAADADRAVADAQRGLVDASGGVTDAQAELNSLLAQGAVDAEKVADAQRSLAAATRGVGHAQREQAKAQAAYDAALANANDLQGLDSAQATLAEASDNLADANDNVADAQDRATQAASDLAAAQAGDPEFNNKLADARQRVADANQKVADAQFALGEKTRDAIAAHEAQTQALSDDADQAGRLEEKLRTLLTLQPSLTSVLSGPLAAINAANTTGGGPGAPLGADLLGSGLLGAGGALKPLSPLIFPSGGGQGKQVTNNFTINTPVDPAEIANRISWTL